jgi:hypothetical protein
MRMIGSQLSGILHDKHPFRPRKKRLQARKQRGLDGPRVTAPQLRGLKSLICKGYAPFGGFGRVTGLAADCVTTTHPLARCRSACAVSGHMFDKRFFLVVECVRRSLAESREDDVSEQEGDVGTGDCVVLRGY